VGRNLIISRRRGKSLSAILMLLLTTPSARRESDAQ